jgi:Xaa-Pro aminopeptidase
MPQVKAAKVIYTLFSPGEGYAQSRGGAGRESSIKSDYWDGRGTREENLAKLLRERFPDSAVEDFRRCSTEYAPSRAARSGVDSPRVATRRTWSHEAMKSTKPGVYEYQLDAAARTFSRQRRAPRRLSFHHPSGTDNINMLHYYRNNAPLQVAIWC